MRVIVDLTACDAHGVCVTQCPEVFDLDDNDKLQVKDTHPPENLRPRVEAAARLCPKACIHVD